MSIYENLWGSQDPFFGAALLLRRSLGFPHNQERAKLESVSEDASCEETFKALEMLQDLVRTMRERGNFCSSDVSKKEARLSDCVCSPSQKKRPKFPASSFLQFLSASNRFFCEAP